MIKGNSINCSVRVILEAMPYLCALYIVNVWMVLEVFLLFPTRRTVGKEVIFCKDIPGVS